MDNILGCSRNSSTFVTKIKSEIHISRSKIRVSVVSHYDYAIYSDTHCDVYCLPTEYARVSKCIDDSNTPDLLSLASEIKKTISKGIFVLLSNDTIIAGAPLFDNSLSFLYTGKELILSDSASDIAISQNASISNSSLALHLLVGLPFYLFQSIPMWTNVKKVAPLCVLKYDPADVIQEIPVWKLPALHDDAKSAYQIIRDTLFESISGYIHQYPNIQADISGGVDSATIVYILHAFNAEFRLFHAGTDGNWSSDSKWARFIADDMGHSFTSLPSIGDSGHKFNWEQDYYGSALVDSPIYWADTEGYINNVIAATSSHNKTVHFSGLGSDGLFSPLPSYAWSVARQNRVRGVGFGLKYCILTRAPFIKCLQDLLDNTDFKESVQAEIGFSFQNKKKIYRNTTLNWIGSFLVPSWLTPSCQEMIQSTMQKVLDKNPPALDPDRTRHQGLESILFQRKIMSQLNRIYGSDEMIWQSPFLNSEIVGTALSLPAKYRWDYKLTKPTLYNSLKGIMPMEVFTRGYKGDYTASRYKEFNKALPKIRDEIFDFELVKRGLVNPDKLLPELSMPNILQDKVEAFERLVAVERWVRNAMRYQRKEQNYAEK